MKVLGFGAVVWDDIKPRASAGTAPLASVAGGRNIDGAIREHTVPCLREAGVDIVVPGSLIFGEDGLLISERIRAGALSARNPGRGRT